VCLLPDVGASPDTARDEPILSVRAAYGGRMALCKSGLAPLWLGASYIQKPMSGGFEQGRELMRDCALTRFRAAPGSLTARLI